MKSFAVRTWSAGGELPTSIAMPADVGPPAFSRTEIVMSQAFRLM
jgi:hypothetical protein